MPQRMRRRPCPHCGEPALLQATFCRSCGARLTAPRQPRGAREWLAAVVLLYLLGPLWLFGNCFVCSAPFVPICNGYNNTPEQPPATVLLNTVLMLAGGLVMLAAAMWAAKKIGLADAVLVGDLPDPGGEAV